MKTDHFKEIGEDLYGYGWQSRLARALGMDGSTVRRWVSGAVPLPPSAAAFLRMMASRQTARGAFVALLFPSMDGSMKGRHNQETLVAMKRKVSFLGVDRPKPLPSFHIHDGELVMDEAESSTIRNHDVVMVRHPDSHHLRGYLAEMEKAGIEPALATGKHHHYTAMARASTGTPVMTQILSTHSGSMRVNISRMEDGGVLDNTIIEIPGSRQGEGN